MYGIDKNIIAAVIGVFAFVVAQTANAFFVWLRDKKRKKEEKQSLALFARAELLNVKRHQEANVIKLNSILKSDGFGDKIDFDKFKLTENGLVALDLAKIYVLKQEIAQDLIRFSLYCRNNELEIINAFEKIEGKFTDNEKTKAVIDLKKRFERTISIAQEISEQLFDYAKSPAKYEKKGVDWPDSLFELQK